MNDQTHAAINNSLLFGTVLALGQGYYASAAATAGKRMPVDQIVDDAERLIEATGRRISENMIAEQEKSAVESAGKIPDPDGDETPTAEDLEDAGLGKSTATSSETSPSNKNTSPDTDAAVNESPPQAATAE